ncbi:MAG: SPW repeat protein [Verrucomicrobia subdivision 3 bacterium]|nr:SPW repeat protein [Limisphaerales bacterium]
MKIIPTHLHGAFDYVCGFMLILSPHLLGISEAHSPERLVPQLTGFFILVQSLMTRYECGVLRVLPMQAHLLSESLAGLFLAISPWVFSFHQASATRWMPHCVAGGALLIAGLLTAESRRSILRPAL